MLEDSYSNKDTIYVKNYEYYSGTSINYIFFSLYIFFFDSSTVIVKFKAI